MAEDVKKEQVSVVSWLPLINLSVNEKQYSFLFPHGSAVEELENACKALSDKIAILKVQVMEAEKAKAEAEKEEDKK